MQIHLHWKDPAVVSQFKTGVSLHSHTNLSEESLDIIPRYTERIPYLGRSIKAQERKYLEKTGKPLDFAHAFWTPPLSPLQALQLEAKQITSLGLKPLVSLSSKPPRGRRCRSNGPSPSALRISTSASTTWPARPPTA